MKNGTSTKIAVGVAIVVFAGLILAGMTRCARTHDDVIRMKAEQHK